MMIDRLRHAFLLCRKRETFSLDIMIDLLMSIEGHISKSEAKQLMLLAQHVQHNTVVVEIGSYRGRSTVALAYGSFRGNRNRVYAIDPYVEFQGLYGGCFGPQDLAKLYRNLLKYKVEDIVSVVSLFSVNAAKGWVAQNVGLLFIDGDHRYEAVQADYNAWAKFVMKDGIIVFHDSDTPDVKRYIDELIEKNMIVFLGREGSLSWFSKS